MSSGISFPDLLTMLSTQVNLSEELLSSLKTCNTLVKQVADVLEVLDNETMQCIATRIRYLNLQEIVGNLSGVYWFDQSHISSFKTIRDNYLEVKAIAEEFEMKVDKCKDEMNAEWEEIESHLETKELAIIERMAVKHPRQVIEKLEIFNKKAAARKKCFQHLLVEWNDMEQELNFDLSICEERMNLLMLTVVELAKEEEGRMV